jgi:hypothetical protein
MSREDALRFLRRSVIEGVIQFLPHVLLRCKERGIDLQDVLRVLKHGMIFAEPELDVRWNQWRYRVEGRSLDQEALAVIVAFADEDTTIVITAVFP